MVECINVSPSGSGRYNVIDTLVVSLVAGNGHVMRLMVIDFACGIRLRVPHHFSDMNSMKGDRGRVLVYGWPNDKLLYDLIWALISQVQYLSCGVHQWPHLNVPWQNYCWQRYEVNKWPFMNLKHTYIRPDLLQHITQIMLVMQIMGCSDSDTLWNLSCNVGQWYVSW